MQTPKPNIEFDENGIPINTDFGDSYYSKSGGLEETKEVFIKACDLENKFANQNVITIGELGFGTGLNFLVVWQVWQKLKKPNGILHFYTFEKFLMPAQTAAKALEKWPELSFLTQKLIEKWPIAKKGNQRIWLDDNIALNIIIGDANETIKLQTFKADAWFLDGFAPRANQDLWGVELFNELKRLSHEDVKIGTYSVAQIVRQSLEKNGFHFKKCAGFGTKRERLEAWLDGTRKAVQRPKSIAIIGGGIAGASIAHALNRRGFEPVIFDDDEKGEYKASNNPRGLFMPRLDRVDNAEARFFKEAYLYAINEYQKLGNCFDNSGAIEIAKHVRDVEKYAMFKENPPFDEEFMEVFENSILHKKGGTIWPKETCDILSKDAIKIYKKIAKIEQIQNIWKLYDENGQLLMDTDCLIIANGIGLNDFPNISNLSVTGRMGQISIAENETAPQDLPIGSNGYYIKLENGYLFGATFDIVDIKTPPEVTQLGHEKNLEILSKFAPNIAKNVDLNNLKGRTSMRVVSKNKMPIAGDLAPNLYVHGALGSRGFSISFLLAEMIASQINNEPNPMDKEVVAQIHPSRL